jgi:hypothetical protein
VWEDVPSAATLARAWVLAFPRSGGRFSRLQDLEKAREKKVDGLVQGRIIEIWMSIVPAPMAVEAGPSLGTVGLRQKRNPSRS